MRNFKFQASQTTQLWLECLTGVYACEFGVLLLRCVNRVKQSLMQYLNLILLSQ